MTSGTGRSAVTRAGAAQELLKEMDVPTVTVDPSDSSCGVFGSISGAETGTILHFLVGADITPRRMTTEDVAAELHDPFATLFLARGRFPATADELLGDLDAQVAAGDLLGRDSQMSFVLGEGSQLGAEAARHGLRFLVSRGSAPHGPELILAAADPGSGLVELMAWDTNAGGFNYYRTLGAEAAWVFAGNSRHALSPPTQGKGPFESHPSGNLIMKELKLPWVHWHSFKVDIVASALPAGSALRAHPWFTDKQGAEVCETAVVMPSIRRWTSERFAQATAADGAIREPARVVEQLVTTPTVNLTSSTRESASTAGSPALDLPPTFFVDADGLALVGLPGPPSLEVPRDVYATSLRTFDFALDDQDGLRRSGDTHFAFVVPERAFEDVETVNQALERGLFSKRLVATLLMVDFANPIFSSRRAALLRHSPSQATIRDGVSTFSTDMAQTVLDAAPTTPEGSPEREFGELWAAGENWPTVYAQLLTGYYVALQQRLTTQVGFDDYTRLAESRRAKVKQMPISEFPLLFATTNIAEEQLMMSRDGTVKAGS